MSGDGRRGGREARRAMRTSMAVRALPALQRKMPLYEVLSPSGSTGSTTPPCACWRRSASTSARTRHWPSGRNAGAKVDGARVHIPRELLMGLVAQAPERFTLHARNPAKSAEIGGSSMVFGPTYGSPFVRGFDGERRYGTIEDLQQLPQARLHGPGAAEHRAR